MDPRIVAALIALVGIVVGAILGFGASFALASIQHRRETQRRKQDHAHELKKLESERIFKARQDALANAIESVSRFVFFLSKFHEISPCPAGSVYPEHRELGVAMERLHTYCSFPLIKEAMTLMRLLMLTLRSASMHRAPAYLHSSSDEQRQNAKAACQAFVRGRLLEIQCAARDFQIAARIELGFEIDHSAYVEMMAEFTEQAAAVLHPKTPSPLS